MLTVTQIRNSKPKNKPYRLTDGHGLYLEILPGGTKSFRYRFKYRGRSQILTIGRFPEITLAEARAARDEARVMLVRGLNPCAEKQKAKIAKKHKISQASTFREVALEWIDIQGSAWKPAHRDQVLRSLQKDVFPVLGPFQLEEITRPQILTVLREIEDRGALDYVRRVLQRIDAIFKYGILTGKGKKNPSEGMQKILRPIKRTHLPALPVDELPQFLHDLEKIDVHPSTKLALKFIILTAVRSSELRFATWDEIDMKNALWIVSAKRMKMKREHVVPLSRQAIAILKIAGDYWGCEGLIFPGTRWSHKPLSENTLQYCLNRMGYGGRATVHGFRSVFSTIANESGLWSPDAIERALAHVDKNSVRAAYNRGGYLEERRKLMQWWADYIDAARMEEKNND